MAAFPATRRSSSPTRSGTREVAERPMRVRVRFARLRVGPPERREDRREQHGADPGQRPRQQRSRAGRKGDRRQRGEKHEDARADHAPDDQRRGQGQTQFSLEQGVRNRLELPCRFHSTLLP